MICHPPWWAYVIMAACAFVVCLILNYIMNRINAARIEKRFAQFLAKNPSNQGTQAQQETMMRMETPKRTITGSATNCVQIHSTEATPAFIQPEQKSPPRKEDIESQAETVPNPSDVISSSKVVNVASSPRLLRTIYKPVQLVNSSKSIDKQRVIPNHENQDIENEIGGKIKEKANQCASSPTLKRIVDDHNIHNENKLRDCLSDTTVTICRSEIQKDTSS